MLRVSEGNRVLDVGCGTGEDARALAQVVGPRGWVVGIDNSRTMIEEATRRQNGLGAPVEFYVGDACQIAFPDGVFDACRADRVFQHLREPRKALSEMIRVTRRGPVSSAIPTGARSSSTALPRPHARIVGFACDARMAGWAGNSRAIPRSRSGSSGPPLVVTRSRHGEGGLGDRGWRAAAQAGVIRQGGRALASRASGRSRRGRFICGLGLCRRVSSLGRAARSVPGSVCHSGG